MTEPLWDRVRAHDRLRHERTPEAYKVYVALLTAHRLSGLITAESYATRLDNVADLFPKLHKGT